MTETKRPADAPPDTHSGPFVAFRVHRHLYALPLDNVDRVLRMVAVTPAPEARPEAAGVINIHGRIVPVVDLRPWFGQTARPPRLDDRLLLIEAGERTAALVVDDVAGVLEVPPRDVKPASTFMHDARPVVAAIRRGDDLVLVLDAVALLPRRGDIGAEGDGQDGMVSGSTRRELISQKGDL